MSRPAPLTNMTQERYNDIADVIKDKAIQVADGFYGDSDEGDGVNIEEWAADLHETEECLRRGDIEGMTRAALEEVENCGDLEHEELLYIRGVWKAANS